MGGSSRRSCAPTGAAQLVLDPALNIAAADRPKVQQAATAWLAWYDSMYSEPAGPADDAWNPPRLEYALSVGTRLSANAQDDMTFSATEIDGPIDWSSFDVNTQASLTTDRRPKLHVARRGHHSGAGELPRGAGAALLGDGRRAHRVRPRAGRSDGSRASDDDRVREQLRQRLVRRAAHAAGGLGHARRLAGRDRYVRRPQSLRPIGDPAICRRRTSRCGSRRTRIRRQSLGADSRHEPLLPAADAQPHASTALRSRTCCSCATRWPIWPGPSSAPSRARSSSRRNATKRPTRCHRIRRPIRTTASAAAVSAVVAGAAELDSAAAGAGAESAAVPNTPGQILSRLKRGAVLQPDGTEKVHDGRGRRPAVPRRTFSSTTRRSRAKARESRVSADWRAGRTARRGCGRRSGTRSDRARARASCSSINCWSRVDGADGLL